MNTSLLKKLQDEFGDIKVSCNEPMSLHTTFKIGGTAEYYINADKSEDIIKAVVMARAHNLPVFILGGGSNVIISDQGLKGIVVKNNCRRFYIVRTSKKPLIFAESGVLMNQLVRFTIEHGLGGLEYQLGLPGTVGGAIFMNSNFPRKGSYVGDVLYKATVITKKGEVKELDNAYFQFGYDKSILQETGEILLSATFKLKQQDKEVLYKRGMEALRYRNETQPKGLSAGCTFRNISIGEAKEIPTPENITSAGYLIDRAGLKGKRIGGAMVSDLHANFILNVGNAKAKDVLSLVDLIKHEVLKKFGVHLYLEVRDVGFSNKINA